MESKRADATRNRELLLDVAARLSMRGGRTPSLAELAADAGLGVGTVYRHFPTRDALADALAKEKLTAMLAAGRAALEGDDAIQPFLREAIAMLAADPTLAEVFTRAEGQNELLAVFGEIVDRAIASGQVRRDLTVRDIHHLVCGGDPDTYADLLLAGMRPAPA